MAASDMRTPKRDDRALEKIANALESIAHEFCRFNNHFFAVLDFRLDQIKGDGSIMGQINGITAGGAPGVFQASLIPSNAAALQSGPTFTADDPQVTLGPDPKDPTNPFNVSAQAAAGDTNASFNLTCNGVNSASNPIKHVFLIPITAAPPPVALDFDLNQLS
jgi:hypothetical protein